MALDATPGGASANSYLTVEEADAYFAGRLHAGVWTAASAEEQEAALVMSTRVIDANVCFTGAASTSTQALTWPRRGMYTRNGVAIAVDAIPQALKDATAELAMLLLSKDRTLESSAEAEGLASLSVGPVSLAFVERSSMNTGTLLTTTQRDGVVNSAVVPAGVLALLVPSWVSRDEASLNRLMVEVL